jgi:hydrogenase maturation protease
MAGVQPYFLVEEAVATVVLGLGNPILCDDGVGIHVVRAVSSRVTPDASPLDVTFAEASVGGLRLLDILAGYERAIIVDAIQTRDGKPGDIYRLHPNDLRASLHSGSTHDLSLPGALALGRGMGMMLPHDEAIVIIALEVEDVLTFGEECTPAVGAAIPRAVEAVLAELGLA